MEAELQSLEERINTLAMLCQQLRHENGELRQQVLVLGQDNRQLQDKVNVTAARIEALLAQMPEEGA